MHDGAHRNIDYLRLSLTDLCNYRCRYCMPAGGVEKRAHGDILTVEELVEIGEAAVACGIKKIRLTGGEPLVRRGLLDICAGLSALSGLEELCLTTNGSLLTELAAPLRRAGLSRLNVSLDTLRQDRFAELTRTGRLQDVLDGIAAAANAGFSDLKLDCVLIGGYNEDEIADMVRLTCHRHWEVRFIELMPMGECAGWEQGCFISCEKVLEVCPQLTAIAPNGVARRYQVPGWAGTVGLIEPMSHRFCAACNRIRVTADGRLKGCLHTREELSLRGLHGQALEQAIRQGILQKPAGHHLTEFGSDTPRRMHEIGG